MRTIHHIFSQSSVRIVSASCHHLMCITWAALLLILLPLLCQSCRKELCYNHWEHAASVKADIDAGYEQEWETDNASAWEQNWDSELFNCEYEELRPGIPGGLRIVVYRGGGYRTCQAVRRGTFSAVLQQRYGIPCVRQPRFVRHRHGHYQDAHPFFFE